MAAVTEIVVSAEDDYGDVFKIKAEKMESGKWQIEEYSIEHITVDMLHEMVNVLMLRTMEEGNGDKK